MSRRISPIPVSDSEFKAMKVNPCFRAPAFLVKPSSRVRKSIDVRVTEDRAGDNAVMLVADNDDDVIVNRVPPNTPILKPVDYRNALGLAESSSEDISDLDLSGDVTDAVHPCSFEWAPTVLCEDDGKVVELDLPIKAPVKRLTARIGAVPPSPPRKRKAAAQLSMADVDMLADDDIEVLQAVGTDRRPLGSVGEQAEAIDLGIVTTGRGKQGPNCKNWVVVWNNPTLSGDEWAKVLEESPDIELAVFQKEVGENGTPHFQCYIELKKRGYHTAVRKAVGGFGMRVENAKAGRKKNFAYCTKEDTRVAGPWFVNCTAADANRKSGNQGKRTDLDDFALVCLEEGGVTERVAEEFPGHAVQFLKHGEAIVKHLKLRKAKEADRAHWKEMWERKQRGEDISQIGMRPREVEILFGPTAVGKTTEVFMTVFGRDDETLFEKAGNTKWWCGYDGESNVLIDEFKGDSFGRIEEMNNMINSGTKIVETKGGSTVLQAERIFITSNSHPSHWWSKDANSKFCWSDAHYRAFARRVARVKWWNDAHELTVLTNPGLDDGSDEWQVANAAWVKFWQWRDRAVQVGDNIDEMARNYFTYY